MGNWHFAWLFSEEQDDGTVLPTWTFMTYKRWYVFDLVFVAEADDAEFFNDIARPTINSFELWFDGY